MESVLSKIHPARNYVNGAFMDGEEWQEVISPLDGSVLSKVQLSGKSAVDEAVAAACAAFDSWSATPVKERVQVLYNYRSLLDENRKELTELISLENGKTDAEAEAEVPDDYGIMTSTREELYATCKKAHDAGWQIGVHSNGDVGIDVTLGVLFVLKWIYQSLRPGHGLPRPPGADCAQGRTLKLCQWHGTLRGRSK